MIPNSEVSASKFYIYCPLTSMSSKMALPYISKIASNQYICSKDPWGLWIVGRDRKNTKSSFAFMYSSLKLIMKCLAKGWYFLFKVDFLFQCKFSHGELFRFITWYIRTCKTRLVSTKMAKKLFFLERGLNLLLLQDGKKSKINQYRNYWL